MKEIVLWDLDGTLTDSQPGIFNSVYYALDEMKVQRPDEATMLKFIGPPLLESYERYCGLTGEKGWEALRLYRVYFAEKGYLENSVYPEVKEALEILKNAGIKQAVATSKPEDYAVKICEHFGLAPYFEGVFGASMDETRNNKPSVIRYALENLGNPDKSKVILIGDRLHDAEGAKEVGIDCMGVTYGYGSFEELKNSGATYIANSPVNAVRHILGGAR